MIDLARSSASRSSRTLGGYESLQPARSHHQLRLTQRRLRGNMRERTGAPPLQDAAGGATASGQRSHQQIRFVSMIALNGALLRDDWARLAGQAGFSSRVRYRQIQTSATSTPTPSRRRGPSTKITAPLMIMNRKEARTASLQLRGRAS